MRSNILTAQLTIAESLYSRVDTEGRKHMSMQEIIEHQFDGNLLPRNDLYLPNSNQMRQTRKGCKLLVSWKDGTTSDIPYLLVRKLIPTYGYTADVNRMGTKSTSTFCAMWTISYMEVWT